MYVKTHSAMTVDADGNKKLIHRWQTARYICAICNSVA